MVLFSFYLRNYFSIISKENLPAMNSPSLCLSDKIFILLLFLNNSFAEYRILG